MFIYFELKMPNRGSWNGRWSGEKTRHIIVRNIGDHQKAREIAERKNYLYRWDDGWTACISCGIVDAKEAGRLKKLSKGFCNYDWMVYSILRYGYITKKMK